MVQRVEELFWLVKQLKQYLTNESEFIDFISEEKFSENIGKIVISALIKGFTVSTNPSSIG